MKRAIAAFGLVGLLSAGLLTASEGVPAVAAEEPAGLCAASTTASLEHPGFLQPAPRTGCSTVAYCPDGSQVSCSGPWDVCEVYYSCSPPYVQCAARCVNTISFCAGYNYASCQC